MAKTLKDLLMALLNATLILLALCLWLAWSVTDRLGEISDQFQLALGERINPVAAGLDEVNHSLERLEAEVTALAENPFSSTRQEINDLTAELRKLNASLKEAGQVVSETSNIPERMARAAVQEVASAIDTRLK